MTAKRVQIVSVKLCREGSIAYGPRFINNPADVAMLVIPFLADSDREQIIAVCVDTKHQPTAIHTVSVGTLNTSMVHCRETFKAAILSNSAPSFWPTTTLVGYPTRPMRIRPSQNVWWRPVDCWESMCWIISLWVRAARIGASENWV